MEKLMHVEHDFYDIVGARVYSEILGWARKRLKDPYTLVGLIDGVWAGFANGRLMSEDVNISLHTMAISVAAASRSHVLCQSLLGFEMLGTRMVGYLRILQWLDAWVSAWLNLPIHGPICNMNSVAPRSTTSPRILGSNSQRLRPPDGWRRSELRCSRFSPKSQRKDDRS
jgi:hypothetical protein